MLPYPPPLQKCIDHSRHRMLLLRTWDNGRRSHSRRTSLTILFRTEATHRKCHRGNRGGDTHDLMRISGGAYCTTCMQTDCSVSTCSRSPCTRLVSFCVVLFFVVHSPVSTRLKPSNGRDEVVCDQTRQFRDSIGQQVMNYRRSPISRRRSDHSSRQILRCQDRSVSLCKSHFPSVPIHIHRHFPRQIGNFGRQPPSRTQPSEQP